MIVKFVFHDDPVHLDGAVAGIDQGSSSQQRVDLLDEQQFLLEYLVIGLFDQVEHLVGKASRLLTPQFLDLDQPDLAGLEAGELADRRARTDRSLGLGASFESGRGTLQQNSGCRLHRLHRHFSARADLEDSQCVGDANDQCSGALPRGQQTNRSKIDPASSILRS